MTFPIETIRANLDRVHALQTAERLAAEYGVPLASIIGRDRHRTPTAARHHLWSLILGSLDLPFAEIAALFGVDHSTVISAVRRREAKVRGERGPGVVVCAQDDFGDRQEAVA